MRVKRIVPLLAGLFLLVSLFPTPVFADGAPPLPHAFYGSLEVNGIPAAPGYQVEATAEGVSLGEGNPIITTELGQYGGPSGLDPKLVVQGAISEGAILTFYVDGVEAETEPANVEWHSGDISEVNLSATISDGGGGGGGGGGFGDTKPPTILDVLLCGEGVTETTADICWKTNERSTSQVEYWASPSMLSPLDETYVIEHHIHLTGLTPSTTYYYKTMSEDRVGNLAVSDVHTFTTLGEAPAAVFTTSNLSISPSECHCGETVTICALITNTGSTTDSCTVTLAINGLVEATKEVTLDAGAGEEITFTTTKDMPGNYSVAVNGISGSFIVTEEELLPTPTPPTPPEEAPTPEVEPPINWTIIGGIIAGVIIVGLIILALARRRAV